MNDHRRHLLLDTRLIDQVENLRLTPGQVEKDWHNPLFAEDKPWEPRFDNLYPNVIFDDDEELFKCWYSPFIVCGPENQVPRAQRFTTRLAGLMGLPREMAVCYATSSDGVYWQKPELGLVEFDGSTANNIVLRQNYGIRENGVHGAGVFKDLHDPDPARRYKMFFKNMSGSIAVSFSPDGLRWADPIDCPQIQSVGDTQNIAFWAPQLERYVGFSRAWGGAPRVRQVCRTESQDFLHWSQAETVLEGLDPQHQLYTLIAFPYAGLYLGLAMIFNPWTDLVHCELAWSADTLAWQRVCPGAPLIARGAEGSIDWGCVYAAANPIRRQDELLLYYGASNGPHTSWRDGFFCLARLRADGFAAYEPASPGATGRLTTQPLICAGSTLRLNADASSGCVRLAVLDQAGYELDACAPMSGVITDGAVQWQGGRNLAELEGRPIRLQFEIKSARLYSFVFTD